MEFKKGMWVRDNEEVFCLERDAEKDSWVDTNCELWKPREREWCWDVKHRGLVQITHEELGVYDMHGYTIHGFAHELDYEDVEPFIGELPGFLKN